MTLTHWYEGLGGRAVTGHADGVDSVDAHLIGHALNHLLGLKGGVGIGVKVQPHPPVALLLLPLQNVAWHEEGGLKDDLIDLPFTLRLTMLCTAM